MRQQKNTPLITPAPAARPESSSRITASLGSKAETRSVYPALCPADYGVASTFWLFQWRLEKLKAQQPGNGGSLWRNPLSAFLYFCLDGGATFLDLPQTYGGKMRGDELLAPAQLATPPANCIPYPLPQSPPTSASKAFRVLTWASSFNGTHLAQSSMFCPLFFNKVGKCLRSLTLLFGSNSFFLSTRGNGLCNYDLLRDLLSPRIFSLLLSLASSTFDSELSPTIFTWGWTDAWFWRAGPILRPWGPQISLQLLDW